MEQGIHADARPLALPGASAVCHTRDHEAGLRVGEEWSSRVARSQHGRGINTQGRAGAQHAGDVLVAPDPRDSCKIAGAPVSHGHHILQCRSRWRRVEQAGSVHENIAGPRAQNAPQRGWRNGPCELQHRQIHASVIHTETRCSAGRPYWRQHATTVAERPNDLVKRPVAAQFRLQACTVSVGVAGIHVTRGHCQRARDPHASRRFDLERHATGAAALDTVGSGQHVIGID